MLAPRAAHETGSFGQTHKCIHRHPLKRKTQRRSLWNWPDWRSVAAPFIHTRICRASSVKRRANPRPPPSFLSILAYTWQDGPRQANQAPLHLAFARFIDCLASWQKELRHPLHPYEVRHAPPGHILLQKGGALVAGSCSICQFTKHDLNASFALFNFTADCYLFIPCICLCPRMRVVHVAVLQCRR